MAEIQALGQIGYLAMGPLILGVTNGSVFEPHHEKSHPRRWLRFACFPQCATASCIIGYVRRCLIWVKSGLDRFNRLVGEFCHFEFPKKGEVH